MDIAELDIAWPAPPEPGEVIAVLPNLLWARLPLPFRLDHINVWLLEEQDGWTVIDTGCATSALYTLWEGLLAGPMRGRPIRRLVATHGHVDHIGLAGWLTGRFDADFVSTFGEWLWARIAHMHNVPGADAAYRAFLHRHGVDAAMTGRMVSGRGGFIDLATPLPATLTELRDRQSIPLGGAPWQTIVTGGHAFQHACFHNADAGVLIAGDHLLPKISPMIAVYEMLPRADPLGDYLASFARFAHIPADTLVLPSHGMPYRGIHHRIAALRAHHRDRLAATADFLSVPRSAMSLAACMFPHVDGPDNLAFALGETIAHVNHLHAQGALEELTDAQGGLTYRRLPDARRPGQDGAC